MLPFLFIEKVLGPGKRRGLSPVSHLRIPAGVIQMHMGTKYIIDRFWRTTYGSEIVQEALILTTVPLGEREILFVVTYTSINKNCVTARLQKKGVDAEQHAFLRIQKVWLEPLQMGIEVLFSLINVEDSWTGGL